MSYSALTMGRVSLVSWNEYSQEIQELRLRCWEKESPWLIENLPDGSDEFDSVSNHLIFKNDQNKVVGAVRWYGKPILIYRNNTLISSYLEAHRNYADIGRLVTEGSASDKVKTSVELLIEAGIDCYKAKEHKGFVGLAKTNLLSFYSKFGFEKAVSTGINFYGPLRNHSFIVSDWKTMIKSLNVNVKKRGYSWQQKIQTL